MGSFSVGLKSKTNFSRETGRLGLLMRLPDRLALWLALVSFRGKESAWNCFFI